MGRGRFVNLAIVCGLVLGLFVAAAGNVAADPSDPGQSTIYFPWVPNGDEAGGSGPWYGTVTVQNTEIYPITVDVTTADGTTLASGVRLNPRASKTWSAAALDIPAPGAGVVVTGKAVSGVCQERLETLSRSSGRNYDVKSIFTGGYVVSVPSASSIENGATVPYEAGRDFNGRVTSDGTLVITWLSGAGAIRPTGIYTARVLYCPKPRIAGVEKHATPSMAGNATTTAASLSVDGYTAVSDADVVLANSGGAAMDGQSRWVLPIVQTNAGWNTILYVTNISTANHAGVVATFYRESGQGVAGSSRMILNETLRRGETVVLDLTADRNFPAGTVGSLWIDADANVVAQVYRVKAETGMALTNVAQPRMDLSNGVGPDATTKYAPLVFRDYNGWNTGLNIANLSSFHNRVTITYYNYAGNVVAVETKWIPPRAMEVVYRPATANADVAAGQITSAVIAGSHPLAASVDEVKYLSGTGQGQAMSYLAQAGVPAGLAADGGVWAGALGRTAYSSLLALPLVQKGDAFSGTGDTSGINLFNPDTSGGINAYVQLIDTAGLPVAPTVDAFDAEQPFVVPMGALSGATIYTMNYGELPDGFVGSAVIGAVDPAGDSQMVQTTGRLVGVSNNVNYDVAHDGAAAFNLAAQMGFLWWNPPNP